MVTGAKLLPNAQTRSRQPNTGSSRPQDRRHRNLYIFCYQIATVISLSAWHEARTCTVKREEHRLLDLYYV